MKKFSDLRNTVLADEARRARVEGYKAELLAELSLADLRRARQLTQAEVAVALDTTQPGISRLEHQADLYISTLRKYVEAIGGKLHVVAEFPDVRVPIVTFASLAEGPSAAQPPAGSHGSEPPAREVGRAPDGAKHPHTTAGTSRAR
jgi:transcriptional regulator with XRE-family HTH domain